MSESQVMLSNERKVVTVSILDKGGEVIDSSKGLPAGWSVKFESSNPDVVGISVRDDGLTADLSSDNVGSSTITVSTMRADGSHLQDSPDVTELEVRNAEPDSQNVSFSEALPESSEMLASERSQPRGERPRADRKLSPEEAIAERDELRKASFNARVEAAGEADAQSAAELRGDSEGLGSFGPDAAADAKAKAESKARRERDELDR